jgi:SAM-dependent methyltransferase
LAFGEQWDEGAARIRALAQAVQDLVRPGDWRGLRALDLGAGDGSIAAELALRGATVVAVEGREQNAAAIVATRERHGIDAGRLAVKVADVRSLDWPALGEFDVIVCSGLLYHLELPAAAALARAMRAACTRVTLVDTEVAWGPVEQRNGYAGLAFREHAPGADPASRATSRLASLDNEHSFWLTRASLHALLHDAGFASSWELGAPGQPRREQRATVAAIVGDRVERLSIAPERPMRDGRPEELPAGKCQRAKLWLTRRGLTRQP